MGVERGRLGVVGLEWVLGDNSHLFLSGPSWCHAVHSARAARNLPAT